MAIELTQTANAKGSGELTGDDLAEFARAIPGSAKVVVVTKKAQDQRDTDSWSLTASWKGEAPTKPSFTHRPGYRGNDERWPK